MGIDVLGGGGADAGSPFSNIEITMEDAEIILGKDSDHFILKELREQHAKKMNMALAAQVKISELVETSRGKLVDMDDDELVEFIENYQVSSELLGDLMRKEGIPFRDPEFQIQSVYDWDQRALKAPEMSKEDMMFYVNQWSKHYGVPSPVVINMPDSVIKRVWGNPLSGDFDDRSHPGIVGQTWMGDHIVLIRDGAGGLWSGSTANGLRGSTTAHEMAHYFTDFREDSDTISGHGPEFVEQLKDIYEKSGFMTRRDLDSTARAYKVR